NLDVDLEESGFIGIATQPWHLEEIEETRALYGRFGQTTEVLDQDAVRKRVDSPTYLSGLWIPNGKAILNPAKLVWGLRRLAESRGVVFHDDSPVLAIERLGSSLVVRTEQGSVRARKVVVATNAYRGPVRRIRRFIAPVYDYVLMTEPLDASQMKAIGWSGREALEDVSNQFHYYRLTADNRILWGGYDAIYHFNNGVGESYDQAGDTHRILAEHFFQTFPQLEGLRFSHRWAGPIATTTRFTATWGTSHDGDLAWVAGYTGLGVAASRFGARVALDLVEGRDSDYTRLEMVRKPPFPFPPEPFRYLGIQITRRAIARSDRRGGRRGPWLTILDRFGVGFDS
ncbi:MAG TPA: FAD-dependent oxidoreductase, partial [Acidimicrobiia bacterium]|nr:FAD-dependent oxidoreductase [Acidimicrobiia bacterium]